MHVCSPKNIPDFNFLIIACFFDVSGIDYSQESFQIVDQISVSFAKNS